MLLIGSCSDDELSCLTGSTQCGDVCVNLQTDQANCGACDTYCLAGQACVANTCQTWEYVEGYDDYGFPDFVPAGEDLLLATSDTVYSYSIADDSWSTAHDSLSLPGGYAYPAWDGDKLWWLYDDSYYSYDIATGVVDSGVVAGMPTTALSGPQNTADEAHNIYNVADDGTIIQYNTVTATMTTFTGPTDLPGDGEETRVAWDSKTAKLYLGDYNSTPFYSLDPADGTLTSLEAFPDAGGFNDAFCSDRHGFIYSTDDSGANHILWIFDTAAGSWEPSHLPFEVGSSGNCTVTGDGYLYLLGDGTMYRLKVF